MPDTVIKAENLGKSYIIGHQEEIGGGYLALREVLVHNIKNFWHKTKDIIQGNPIIQGSTREDFWALKDVSFEIQRGEAVGIIGRNGAGKSTLLKILSRITEPSAGRVTIKGRVASLLEVGTGFHPELTGRENIYLNGSILGMTRIEIKRNFDEIVSFSGVEKFLDTPVKRYSSGMYVRLAFAVAAHLEPEILVIDEVLAVGDAEFQKKCLGKMGEVASEGRTVLVVSHNMGAILNLCQNTILLNQGKLIKAGNTEEVVRYYLASNNKKDEVSAWNEPEKAPGNKIFRLHAVRINSDGAYKTDVAIDKDIQIEVEYWILQPGTISHTSIHLLDKLGTVVLASTNFPSASIKPDQWFDKPHPVGLFKTSCTIPANFLNEGIYSIHVILLSNKGADEVFVKDVTSFTVYETGEMRKEYTGVWIGVVRPKLAWKTELLNSSKEPGKIERN